MLLETPSEQPRPTFSLFDATSIIVGIVIGSGVYRTANSVAGRNAKMNR